MCGIAYRSDPALSKRFKVAPEDLGYIP